MDSILRSALAGRLGLRMGAVRRLSLLGLMLLAAGFGSSAAVSAQDGVAAKAPAGKAAAGSKAAATAPKADPASAAEQAEDLRMAQTILGELGLYEGEPDGKLNAATEKALREFQGEAGLEATGKLDQFTTDALLEVMESIEEEEQLGGIFADEDEDFEDDEESDGPPPQCRGYNLDTESPVAGSCTDGKFEGIDEETGSIVTGKCAAGGDLDGQDVATKQRVAGTCG